MTEHNAKCNNCEFKAPDYGYCVYTDLQECTECHYDHLEDV